MTSGECWPCGLSVDSRTERIAILGYFEDGPDLVTMAMNGWGVAEPAWWLNLQAHPDATVDLVDGPRAVRARAAVGDERRRLWARWADYDKNLDQYAALRSRETAVVIFEPRQESAASQSVGVSRGSRRSLGSETAGHRYFEDLRQGGLSDPATAA